MKVLFLNPPFKSEYGRFSRTSRSPAITRAGTVYYPFWLAAAAAATEEDGFKIKFIDAPADRISLDEVVVRAKRFNPKLIIVDTSTPSIFNDVSVANLLKKHIKGVKVALVGTHVSALPKETLEIDKSIDAVCVEEYDYTVRDLARAVKSKKPLKTVEGLAFRDSKGNIIVNKKRELIKDLDKLPMLSKFYKKHLRIENYFFAACDYPMIMLITGRGCPGRCTFCVYPQVFHRRMYRFRSAKNIFEEFKYIKKNLPQVKEVGIEDDTFTAHIPRTREFCQMMIDSKLKLKWYCNVRVTLDLETMKLMKKAGCVLVTVGFESGNQKVLDEMKKGITVEQIREFVKSTKKAGILVHGCFMAGNKGETRETLEETLNLAKEINTDSMQFYPLIVYPGTESYEWARKSGYIISDNFAEWCDEVGSYKCVVSLPELSANDLVEYCNRAIREYVVRPRYIIEKVGNLIKRPEDIKRTVLYTPEFIKKLINDKLNAKEATK
jgi:anaerobic magnesium-protoporphyrin IX monomethyl ester cyclase